MEPFYLFIPFLWGLKETYEVFEPKRRYVDVRMRIEIFPCPKAQEEARARNFSKSQRLYGGGARNFSKFQGPYRYGSAKSNILRYFFIFSTYSYIFPIYSFIFDFFLHIFHIFPSYLLHQGIPECDVIRRGVEGGSLLANPDIT